MLRKNKSTKKSSLITMKSDLPALTVSPEDLGIAPGSFWWRYATTMPSVLGLIARRLYVAKWLTRNDPMVLADLELHNRSQLHDSLDKEGWIPGLADDRAILLFHARRHKECKFVWLTVCNSEEAVVAEAGELLNRGFSGSADQLLAIDLDSGCTYNVIEPPRKVHLNKRKTDGE